MYIYIESLLNLYSIHGRYNHVRAPLTFIHWEHFEMYKALEVIDSHAHPMQSLEEIKIIPYNSFTNHLFIIYYLAKSSCRIKSNARHGSDIII